LDPKHRYLFVIDGSKALRSAINWVSGSASPVQRCRHHKIKNVCDQLPDDLADQVKTVMQVAYHLPWQEGLAKLKKQAEWLRTHYPGAAAQIKDPVTCHEPRLAPSPQTAATPGPFAN
jgi:transposase-like protein